jgi:hypothetical protein
MSSLSPLLCHPSLLSYVIPLLLSSVIPLSSPLTPLSPLLCHPSLLCRSRVGRLLGVVALSMAAARRRALLAYAGRGRAARRAAARGGRALVDRRLGARGARVLRYHTRRCTASWRDRHTAAPINYFSARTASGSATMWRTPARSGLSSVLVVRRSSRLMLFVSRGWVSLEWCGAVRLAHSPLKSDI